jgi:hypothetical protein
MDRYLSEAFSQQIGAIGETYSRPNGEREAWLARKIPWLIAASI